MVSDFQKYLYHFTITKLPSNRVAKVVVLNYQTLNKSSREALFEQLLLHYSRFSEAAFRAIQFAEEGDAGDDTPKDLRIQAIRLSNIGGIPSIKEGIDYGIDLKYNDRIHNAVILGPNGSGKSSIYNGLEYVFTGSVSQKDIRTKEPSALTQGHYLKYLSHFDEKPNFRVVTPAASLSLAEPLKISQHEKGLNSRIHFISDYEIYSKGKIDYSGGGSNSFHELVAKILGLEEYLQFNSTLQSLVYYRRMKESNRRRALQRELDELYEELQRTRSLIAAKKAQITELKNNVATSYNSVAKSGENVQISRLISDLHLASGLVWDDTTMVEAMDSYFTAFNSFKGLSVNADLQKEAEFLQIALELSLVSESCPLCKNSNYSVDEIRTAINARLSQIGKYSESLTNLETAYRELQEQITLFVNNLSNVSSIVSGIIDKSRDIAYGDEERTLWTDFKRKLVDLIDRLNEVRDPVPSAANSPSNRHEVFYNRIVNSNSLLRTERVNIVEAIPNLRRSFAKVRGNLENRVKLFSHPEEKNATEQSAILNAEIKQLQTKLVACEANIARINPEIDELTAAIDAINQIKNETEELSNLLGESINNIVASSFEPVRDVITSVLSEYLKNDGVSLHIYTKEIPGIMEDSVNRIIVAELNKIDDSTGEILSSVPPDKYFNTFRYRLFCMMVSVSLIIASRKNTGINLPIVIDDVFYASDYESKSSFKSFLVDVLTQFRRFNGHMPLQFIVLSHDELIFDCAIDAVSEFEQANERILNGDDASWLQPLSRNTIFARLFPASETPETPSKSPFGDFWDLIYRLPSMIQLQFLTEK